MAIRRDDGELIENGLVVVFVIVGWHIQQVFAFANQPGGKGIAAAKAGDRGGNANGVFKSSLLAFSNIRGKRLVQNDE